MKNICIVSPDFVGPMNNGGIGTHCYWLAKDLRGAGHNVTVIYTGVVENKNAEYWKRHYSKEGIIFESAMQWPDPSWPMYGGGWYTDASMKVYNYLKNKRFDFVHFQEWQANGYLSIQAKRTGAALQDTILTVTMHSSSQWIREGMLRWPDDPRHELVLDYCERYCCEHADILISPSRHMFQWALNKKWMLSKNRYIIPYCYKKEVEAAIPGPPDPSHLIFFGRLETRKGLEIFIEALRIVLAKKNGKFKKVSFLGKHNFVTTGKSVDYIKAFKKNYPALEIFVEIGFDTFEAMEYIKKSAGVVVMPSLVDNYPYTVIECIQNKVHFLAANTGGIPEMVNTEERLFEPQSNILADKLLNIDSIISKNVSYNYSPELARSQWLELHKQNPSAVDSEIEKPSVSVCIPYYNHGQYLPDLLESLKKSDYPNFEIILVDDGSTDESSKTVFDTIKNKFGTDGWKFLKKENGGPGQARNFAVTAATGDLIVFIDADNVATPEMISQMVKGILTSGVDCLTCHHKAFFGDIASKAPIYSYTPVGACVEAGLFFNVFGDTNLIIKKKVFEELSGFGEEKGIGFEDYEFLARICLRGYTLDVIPEPLFWYRHLNDSYDRITNKYRNQQSIVEVYKKEGPESLRFLWNNVAAIEMQTHKLQQKTFSQKIRPIYILNWSRSNFRKRGLTGGIQYLFARITKEFSK